MKQKHLLVTEILSMALVFILMLTACSSDDSGGDGDGDDGTWVLPSPSGNNEVSGKTWFIDYLKIVYTARGTYTRYTQKWDWDDGGDYVLDNKGHYTYSPIETGSYSWNETKKMITHKKKTTVLQGDITSTVLLNKKEYKKALIKDYDDNRKWWHQWLEYMGISEDEYINNIVDGEFSAWMADYCFSSDGESLLMQKALPDNVLPDEFSNQTYKPANYMDSRYAFYSDGTYIFWAIYSQQDTINETGTFAYDGKNTNVFFKPLTIEGKTLIEYYDSIESIDPEHEFENDAAYKAADANNLFQMRQYGYLWSNKTIDY